MSNQQQFRQWKVDEEIGRGADGICYRVIKDDYSYVLKVPANRRAIPRLLHEIQVLSEIDYPNIISIVDYNTDKSSPWMVTPYQPRQTLNNKQFKGVTAEEINTFCVELSNTVAWLHANGIAHGNIARPNVLVSIDYKPILIDFAQCLREGNDKFNQRRAIDMYDMGMLFAWIFSANACQFTKQAYGYKKGPIPAVSG